MKYELKIVKTWQDANILLDKGYTIKHIDRDKFNRERLIFWFKYDEGIDEELDNISKMKKSRNIVN